MYSIHMYCNAKKQGLKGNQHKRIILKSYKNHTIQKKEKINTLNKQLKQMQKEINRQIKRPPNAFLGLQVCIIINIMQNMSKRSIKP